MAFEYKDRMQGTTTEKNTEHCQFCDTDQEIPVNRITRCPWCGNYLRPCGECDTETNGCNWSRTTGCWRFPFPTPLELDTEVRLADGTAGFIRDYDCEDDGDDLSQFCAYHVDFAGEEGWEVVYHGEIMEYRDTVNGKEVWLKNFPDAWVKGE